jgi:hypothetical protein
MRKNMVAIAVSVLLSATTAVPARPQEAQVLVGANQQIKKGFKTYSLFLVCNPSWLQPRGTIEPQTEFLYRSFLNFGHAIGDDNLAVWFWSSPAGLKTTSPTAENIDVGRSARFCQAWHLKPSEGPHLVITSTFPKESDLKSGLPKDSAVFQLGNMTDDQITRLLTKLTDQLLLSGKVDQTQVGASQPAPQPKDAPPLWVRLLDAAQTSINSFGCAWTFKIDAGAVKADLHACQAKPAQ